jgi:hypothetical protein
MKQSLAAAERQEAYESMLADLQSGECVVFDDSRSGPTIVRFCGKQLGIINEEDIGGRPSPSMLPRLACSAAWLMPLKRFVWNASAGNPGPTATT